MACQAQEQASSPYPESGSSSDRTVVLLAIITTLERGVESRLYKQADKGIKMQSAQQVIDTPEHVSIFRHLQVIIPQPWIHDSAPHRLLPGVLAPFISVYLERLIQKVAHDLPSRISHDMNDYLDSGESFRTDHLCVALLPVVIV